MNIIQRLVSSFSNRLSISEVNRLAGLCEGILADDKVVKAEAEALQKLFRGDPRYRRNLQIAPVVIAVEEALADGVLTADEAGELRTVLSEFCDRVLREAPLITNDPQKGRPPVSRKGPLYYDAKTGQMSDTPAERDEEKPRPRLAEWDYPKYDKPYVPIQPKVVATETTPPTVGDVFEISYTDANGDTSDRQISFRSCSRKGGILYVNAICLTRNAYRTFRADRIDDATNTNTGEWISDPASYFGMA